MVLAKLYRARFFGGFLLHPSTPPGRKYRSTGRPLRRIAGLLEPALERHDGAGAEEAVDLADIVAAAPEELLERLRGKRAMRVSIRQRGRNAKEIRKILNMETGLQHFGKQLTNLRLLLAVSAPIISFL